MITTTFTTASGSTYVVEEGFGVTFVTRSRPAGLMVAQGVADDLPNGLRTRVEGADVRRVPGGSVLHVRTLEGPGVVTSWVEEVPTLVGV